MLRFCSLTLIHLSQGCKVLFYTYFLLGEKGPFRRLSLGRADAAACKKSGKGILGVNVRVAFPLINDQVN